MQLVCDACGRATDVEDPCKFVCDHCKCSVAKFDKKIVKQIATESKSGNRFADVKKKLKRFGMALVVLGAGGSGYYLATPDAERYSIAKEHEIIEHCIQGDPGTLRSTLKLRQAKDICVCALRETRVHVDEGDAVKDSSSFVRVLNQSIEQCL